MLRNKFISRIFFASGIVFLTVVCVFLFSFIRLNVLSHRQQTEINISAVYNTLDYLLKNQTTLLSFAADTICADENIKPLVASKEREKLYDYMEDFTSSINSKYGITHVYFHGLDRRKILRMYKPEKYGDLTERFTLKNAIETKKVSSGLEIGKHGTFTLRLVQPIFMGKEIIGYIEVGKELDEIISLLKNYFSEDIAVLISKDKMNRLKWENRPKRLKYDFKWNTFDNYALVYSTARAVSPFLESFLEKGYSLEEGEATFKYKDQYVFLSLRPFLDASGTEVGKLVVSRAITSQVKADIWFVAISITVAVLVFVFIVGCFYFVTLKYDRTLVAAQDEFKKESDVLYASFASIRDAVIWFDMEGYIVNCNKGVFNLFGLKKQELVGRSYLDICSPDKREQYKKTFKDYLVGRNNSQEFEMLTNTGQIKVINIAFSLVEIGDRKILQGVLRDVTVKHTLFKKYKESLMSLRTLVNAIPLPFYSVDKKGVYQICNKAFASTLKREVDDIVGLSAKDIYPKEIAERYMNSDKKTVDAKEILHLDEKLYVEGEGERRAVFYKHAVLDGKGDVEAIVSVVNDALVLDCEEDVFFGSDSKLHKVLDSLSYGIILIDEDMHLIYMNAKMKQWFPYSQNMKGKTCYSILDSSNGKTECKKCCIDKVFAEGRSVSRNIEKMVDSQKRLFKVTAYSVHGQNGQVDRVVEIFEDITDFDKSL